MADNEGTKADVAVAADAGKQKQKQEKSSKKKAQVAQLTEVWCYTLWTWAFPIAMYYSRNKCWSIHVHVSL